MTVPDGRSSPREGKASDGGRAVERKPQRCIREVSGRSAQRAVAPRGLGERQIPHGRRRPTSSPKAHPAPASRARPQSRYFVRMLVAPKLIEDWSRPQA